MEITQVQGFTEKKVLLNEKYQRMIIIIFQLTQYVI